MKTINFDNCIGSYDKSLFYKNDYSIDCADPGAVWVSKEMNEEWGGYFYQYMSGCAGVANSVPSTENGETPPLEHANGRVPAYYGITAISRSKDLNDWQLCGQVDNGLAIRIELDEWLQTSLWAPEAIYDPVTDLYYMFFSAASKINDGSIPGAEYSSSNYLYDRFYLGIAVSENPAGPFRLVDNTNFDATTGEFKRDGNGEIIHCINPAFMLDKELDNLFYTDEFKSSSDFVNKDEDFSAIDINPVFDYDEEGNRTFYIYFVKHVSRNNTDGNQIWVIRMKDMVTPEYETITKCVPTYHGLTVRYKGADDGSEFPADPAYPRHLDSSWETIFEDADGNKKEDLPASEQKNEWSVVEAPQMLVTKDKDGKKVYLVTYSPRGVGSGDYDVKWAYGYSPFGPFTKTVDNWTNTTLGVDATNNFMSNLGHVQFLEVGGEWWIAHWECPEPFTGGVNPGRIYALSSMSWQYEESLGFSGNRGPDLSCGGGGVYLRLPGYGLSYDAVHGTSRPFLSGPVGRPDRPDGGWTASGLPAAGGYRLSDGFSGGSGTGLYFRFLGANPPLRCAATGLAASGDIYRHDAAPHGLDPASAGGCDSKQ